MNEMDKNFGTNILYLPTIFKGGYKSYYQLLNYMSCSLILVIDKNNYYY